MTIAPEWLLRVATDAVLRRWLDVMNYQIRVESGLDQHWASWFEGIQITQEPGGVTLIAADVADQAALHGLLAKVRDLACH